MQTVCRSKPAWLAPALRFVFPGLAALLLLPAPARCQSAWPPGDFRQTPGGLIASGSRPDRCPLPPVSAFTLQANLHKYLEAWPTPGSTITQAWPDSIPEDEADVD